MNALHYLVSASFLACFLSFIWGMQRFFRVDGDMPAGARLIQLAGAASLIAQLAATRSAQITVAAGVLATLLYTLSLVLFWCAIKANWRRPLTAAFSDDAPRHIVLRGPYRLVRHPVYSSYLLAWMAGVVATREPWLLVTVVAMGVIYYVAARKEERKFMSGPLAADYAAYRSRTGMFVPMGQAQ